MTDTRDQSLQALFEQPSGELDNGAFTDTVMSRTRFLKYRLPAAIYVALLAITITALFLTPPLQEFAVLVSQALATPLLNLGEGWIGWLLAPVNSVAGLLVLLAKACRVAWKKLSGPF